MSQPVDTTVLMYDDLAQWCRAHLDSEPVDTIFRSAHLSEVVGLRLADGRDVVVKIRPGSARLDATTEIQRQLRLNGFPCPEVLAGPSPFGDLAATAETYVPPRGRPPESPPPAETAQLLASLVEAAPPADGFPALDPPPPWVAWDHPGDGLWPWPDDLDVDMNQHPGPAWVDHLARRIRARLASRPEAPVIGHVDWEAHNLGWDGGRPVLAHDWDSLAIRDEAGIAGAAAAVYSTNGTTSIAATLDQSAAFLEAYARRRPLSWSGRSEQVAWCSGLWVITYNAKKEVLGWEGTGYLEHLDREHGQRCALAGL